MAQGPGEAHRPGTGACAERTAEIGGAGIGKLDLEAHVPRRRITDLAS
ncbi:MAG: hypothetical protein ACRDOU_33275 [Streptosporangiaceae bacterium]